MRSRAVSLAIALLLTLTAGAHAREADVWERYKAAFLGADGRIIDTGHDKTSHSEGQGYGMLFAAAHNDRRTFDLIWQWTKNNLRVRTDRLFAWQWGKRPTGEWMVIDHNNATDGDLLIALALLRAADRWKEEAYRGEAAGIAADIRRLLAVSVQGRTFLLPGYFGFDRKAGLVLNPSYLIFPAFRALARVDDKAFWLQALQDGLFLIERSAANSLGFPPDWALLAGDQAGPAPGKDPYFGADALRVLLNLADEDADRYPRGVRAVLDQYRRTGSLPLWFDLEKNSASLKPAAAGYYAVYAVAAAKLGERKLAGTLLQEARERLAAEQDAYYSCSLYLLATAVMNGGLKQ